jgi:hypothetical protein
MRPLSLHSALLLGACSLILLARAAPVTADESEVETTCLYTEGMDVCAHRGTANHGPAELEPVASVGGTLTGDTHRYWLQFDFGALPDDVDQIVGATLTVMAKRKSLLQIGVAIGDDNWTPATLTWNGQILLSGADSLQEYSFVENTPYSWDVTNQVAARFDAGSPVVTLVMMQSPEGARSGNIQFARDDYAATDAERPTLCVSYTRKAQDAAPSVSVGEPIELWPPNHQWERFSLADLAMADDAEDGPLDLLQSGAIVSVRSDEPADSRGDGDTEVDICIRDDTTVLLRAERSARGNGRVYCIEFVVTDSAGNETLAKATVTVKVKKRGDPAVDDGAEAGHTVTRMEDGTCCKRKCERKGKKRGRDRDGLRDGRDDRKGNQREGDRCR